MSHLVNKDRLYSNGRFLLVDIIALSSVQCCETGNRKDIGL